MKCADDECAYRHCQICDNHLDGGEVSTCWTCIGRVRRDLIAIMDLVALLPAHALHGANRGKLIAAEPIPGGDALVLLGRGSEGLSEDGTTNVGDPEPPSYVLGFWEEVWRQSLALNSRKPPWQRPADRTLITAWLFIDRHLDWAAHYFSAFAQFAGDLRRTRGHLEALLHAGDSPMQGISCPECGGTLEREYRSPRPCSCPPRPILEIHRLEWDLIHSSHDQGGLHTPELDHGWACRGCRREFAPSEYRHAVERMYDEAAEFRTQTDITRLTGVKRGTLQGWASRGHVRRRKDSSGRSVYSIIDVRARLAADSSAPA